jgi:hypothetical protein
VSRRERERERESTLKGVEEVAELVAELPAEGLVQVQHVALLRRRQVAHDAARTRAISQKYRRDGRRRRDGSRGAERGTEWDGARGVEWGQVGGGRGTRVSEKRREQRRTGVGKGERDRCRHGPEYAVRAQRYIAESGTCACE